MTKQDMGLQKIQVLENSYQRWFNLKATLFITLIIGFVILISTVTYQNLINLQIMVFADLLIVVIFVFALYHLYKSHKSHIQYIDGLIMKVEKGERLGSIEELRKSKIAKSKPKATDDKKQGHNATIE